ncbi:biotin/lipoyl-containing protein [Nitrosophilus alvini]|uniref:biotin/lipoyl-containing protein n=1 Tax=Nitrosophilus alvini TaxID=2714855 RepID=UPI00190B712D|nr:biotin/lipoyl-containing protein [Nitrosophilus alvini]
MAKKIVEVMDTTFRDGFQSVFGGRVLMNDFLPAVEAAKEAGIRHFEMGGGARFQTLFFYLNENAFEMMDRFKEVAGPEANLQTLARGISCIALDTVSSDILDLHAKLFKKHGVTTIRNFDALNDVDNLKASSEFIIKHGLKHEVVITIMDLPPGCSGAHDVEFYEKILDKILEKEIYFDSFCFKDASGTANPQKVYETIKMARKKLPENTHLRLHTHETAGASVACYLAALEAGADGIDLAVSPVSGGTSQPDFLTMWHALKGKNFDLGFDPEKILSYEQTLEECLHDYFIPPEAKAVSALIPFSPMPGGALTANTQMMRDNNMLDKYPEVIKEMREVVEKGGFGTSVTPVSQFYFQQAFNNVMFGKWKKIAEGYGRMVLGYFGKTPVQPDPEIVKIASEQLNLEPTDKNPLELANEDPNKSVEHAKRMLKDAGVPVTDENIFIAAICDVKGIEFLKGNGKVMVRKKSDMEKEQKAVAKAGELESYTVIVDGEKYSVQVMEGEGGDFEIKEVKKDSSSSKPSSSEGVKVEASVPGSVFKILAHEGQKVKEGEPVIILEAMKMEIEVNSPKDGVVKSINVNVGDTVESGQLLAVIE